MKLKAISIIVVIVLSLIPVYMLYKCLLQAMRPRDSMTRFLCWLLAIFALVFTYTFLVVFIIKMLLPDA